MSIADRGSTWLAAAGHATRAHHHLGAVVAAQLMANFELALTTEQRPYFTHTNLARRRGVSHRNTSRRIIAALEAAGLLIRTRYRRIGSLGHANFSFRWGAIYAYVRRHGCRRMAHRPATPGAPGSSGIASPPVPRALAIPRHTPPTVAPAARGRAQGDALRRVDTSAERAAALAEMRRALFGADSTSRLPSTPQN